MACWLWFALRTSARPARSLATRLHQIVRQGAVLRHPDMCGWVTNCRARERLSRQVFPQ